jgi:3-oxoacyl-[acyl-carrier protein] reductase
VNVLITGASSGIGAATALRYAARGAGVGLVARRADRLEAVATQVRALGGRACVAVADVGERTHLQRAVSEVVAALGPVDVLICNAGMPDGGRFADLEMDHIERVMAVNVTGAIAAAKAVLPSMLARRTGAIVLVASIAGRSGAPGSSVYSASKFALVGLGESLSGELRDHGVRVAVVNPGPVRTESWPHRRLPRALVLEPEAVARAIERAAERGPAEVTIPSYYRLAVVLGALAPGVHRRLVRRLLR